MNILFKIFVARLAVATNYADNSCYPRNYNELCSKQDSLLFSSENPKPFPSTKQSCYWKLYSDLIYYEYINYNTSKQTLRCTETIKDRCGLAVNDIVTWMNRQEAATRKCIEAYFEEYNDRCYEESCKYAFHASRAAVYVLPFCSQIILFTFQTHQATLVFRCQKKLEIHKFLVCSVQYLY